ncbi:50S ribosomal protein L13 [Candidatus Saccharibacteria bacterium]|nr:50S ribosomal protein L13 [Candidatus Saccharibacteria bacterium]
MIFKTYSKKAGDVEHKWVLIDAADLAPGRVATVAAERLTGKYQPTYTPHIDSGDHVVIINAKKSWLSGDKYKEKKYHSYSGYHGGIKETNPKAIGKVSVIERAVRGMLPKNKLQADRMKRLHVYADENHIHEAQKPTPLVIARSEMTKQSKKEVK